MTKNNKKKNAADSSNQARSIFREDVKNTFTVAFAKFPFNTDNISAHKKEE